MTSTQTTIRIRLFGLAALLGLTTACAPLHQGQSRYGTTTSTYASDATLRPSCNTYVQTCGFVNSGFVTGGYVVENHAYAPPVWVQPAPEPQTFAIQEPTPAPPVYVEPPAPEPELPVYAPIVHDWPVVDAPAPTWTPLRK